MAHEVLHENDGNPGENTGGKQDAYRPRGRLPAASPPTPHVLPLGVLPSPNSCSVLQSQLAHPAHRPSWPLSPPALQGQGPGSRSSSVPQRSSPGQRPGMALRWVLARLLPCWPVPCPAGPVPSSPGVLTVRAVGLDADD